jgi:hypothetical protein
VGKTVVEIDDTLIHIGLLCRPPVEFREILTRQASEYSAAGDQMSEERRLTIGTGFAQMQSVGKRGE